MWAFVVPVVHKCSMGWVEPCLGDVRLMECFDLTDRGWSSYACHDVLDIVSTAELRELRSASSGRIELGSSVREDLCWFTVLLDAFFE